MCANVAKMQIDNDRLPDEWKTAVTQALHQIGKECRPALLMLANSYPNGLSQRDLLKSLTEPKLTDNALRQRIFDIRKKLSAFYEQSGQTLDWKVGILDGYVLEIAPNADFYLRRFWQPHLPIRDSQPKTHISYTELRFFRAEKERFFFRHADVNDLTSENDLQRYATALPAFGACLNIKDRHDCYFFTTTGELKCLLSLVGLMHKLKVGIEYASTQDDKPRPEHYLLLLGNPRTHPLIREIQGTTSADWKWTMGDHGIYEKAETSAASEHYRYADFSPLKDGTFQVFGFLHRCVWQGRVVTMIVANHGRFFEAMADAITTNSFLQSTFQRLGMQGVDRWATAFQILFAIRVDKTDRRRSAPIFIAAHQWEPSDSDLIDS